MVRQMATRLERTFDVGSDSGAVAAKLIWGGEAVAVTHGRRANPNQLLAAKRTREGITGPPAIRIDRKNIGERQVQTRDC